MSQSNGTTNIRNKAKRPTPIPLAPGDVVTSHMRPDVQYTVIERDSHMVRVRSLLDGGEGWLARSVLRRVEQ